MGLSRRQRGKAEGTFLESIKESLQELRTELIELKSLVKDVRGFGGTGVDPYSPVYDSGWDSWNTWQLLGFSNDVWFDSVVTGSELYQDPMMMTPEEVAPLGRDQLLTNRSAMVVGDSIDDGILCARAIATESSAGLAIHTEVCDSHCCDGIVYKQWQPSQQNVFKGGSSLDVALRNEAALFIQQWYRRVANTRADVESKEDFHDRTEHDLSGGPGGVSDDFADVACHDDDNVSHDGVSCDGVRERGESECTTDSDDEDWSSTEPLNIGKFNAVSQLLAQELDLEDLICGMRGIDVEFSSASTFIKVQNVPEDYTRNHVEGLLRHYGLGECFHFVWVPQANPHHVAFVKCASQEGAKKVVQKLQGFEAWSSILHKILDCKSSDWVEFGTYYVEE